MRAVQWTLAFGSGLALLTISLSHAQDCDVAKLLPSDVGVQEMGFGHAIATDGVRLLIGSPGATPCGPRTVRVHRWDGADWVLEQVLEAPFAAGNRRFGAALAIQADVAVVGAEPSGSEVGQAYIYRRDATSGQWGLEQTLIPTDPSPDQQFFANAVAIDGEWIAIGASGDNDLGPMSGSVYPWRLSATAGSWLPAPKLTASDGEAWSSFGYGLDIDGDVIIAGARRDDGQGAAYIFRLDPAIPSWSEEQKLIAPAGAADDHFGFAVSVSGDRVLVGAPGRDDLGDSAGAVYAFRHDPIAGTWGDVQVLTAAGAAAGHIFGRALDHDGDTAVIAAYGDDGPSYSGAGHLFRLDPSGTWVEEATWTPYAGDGDPRFGFSVALAGEVAAVSAAFLHSPFGAVFLFRDTPGGSFAEETRIDPWDGMTHEYFGSALAMDGDRAVVGTRHDNEWGEFSGSATVFRRDPILGDWVIEDQLSSSTPIDGENFGAAVAMSGDAILVGNALDPALGLQGSAWIHRREPAGTWIEEQALATLEGSPGDAFGSAVAIEGDLAVVGAWLDDELGDDAGAVHLFRRDAALGTWSETQKLLASDGAAGDGFGIAVAIEGDVIVVGSSIDDTTVTTGAAYAFRRDPATDEWSEEQILHSSDASHWDGFGRAVAVEGDWIAIGSPLDDAQSYDFGSVTVFRFDALSGAWSEGQILTTADAASYDRFGSSVALSGDLLAIAAIGDDVASQSAGSITLFRRHESMGMWVEEGSLPASTESIWAEIGLPLALQGDTLLAGIWQDDVACLPVVCPQCDAGAVRVIDLALCALGPDFVRGDSNVDGVVDIGDPVHALAYLFADGPGPCLDSSDSNDDGVVDIADPVRTLSRLFGLAGPLPPPYPACGGDPTADPVHCAGSACP